MENINETRKGFDHLGEIYPKEASVKVERASVSEVNCYWFTPVNAQPEKIIIYLHGGVYALGSIRSHGAMLTHFANKLRSRILFVDYALAPENPYPAANNDVFNVYRELLASYPGYQINFIGDSAGGGLIVAAVNDMLQHHLLLPASVAMISPWIDLACNNASYDENSLSDSVLQKGILAGAAAGYAGKTAIDAINPKNIEFSKFPRVLIVVGTNEVLLDDSRNFYNYIKDIQNDATLTIYENQTHVWPLSSIDSEASQKTLAEIDSFLTKK